MNVFKIRIVSNMHKQKNMKNVSLVFLKNALNLIQKNEA